MTTAIKHNQNGPKGVYPLVNPTPMKKLPDEDMVNVCHKQKSPEIVGPMNLVDEKYLRKLSGWQNISKVIRSHETHVKPTLPHVNCNYVPMSQSLTCK